VEAGRIQVSKQYHPKWVHSFRRLHSGK